MPPNSQKPKKLKTILKKKIEQIKGHFTFITPLILNMVSHVPHERPNIFKIKFKLEKVLFNYNFKMLGISRNEMYRTLFSCISFNDVSKSRNEKKSVVKQTLEHAQKDLSEYQARAEEELLPQKAT